MEFPSRAVFDSLPSVAIQIPLLPYLRSLCMNPHLLVHWPRYTREGWGCVQNDHNGIVDTIRSMVRNIRRADDSDSDSTSD